MIWEAPTGDNTQDIENYQILCRRKDQPTVPVKDSEYRTNNRYWFSVCLNGSMYRRPPPTLTDNSPIAPEDNIPAAVAGQFPIHPAFICSDRISAANTGSFSTRVDGLENNVDYEMLVIAIDKNGNPSASQTIVEGRQGMMPPMAAAVGTADDVKNVANYVLSLSGSPHNELAAQLGKPKFGACAACHGPDGKGNKALGAPNLTDKIWLHGWGEEAILAMVNNGKTNVMPAQASRMSPEQIHVLAAYVWNLAQASTQK